jgi:hypothetical protein
VFCGTPSHDAGYGRGKSHALSPVAGLPQGMCWTIVTLLLEKYSDPLCASFSDSACAEKGTCHSSPTTAPRATAGDSESDSGLGAARHQQAASDEAQPFARRAEGLPSGSVLARSAMEGTRQPLRSILFPIDGSGSARGSGTS